MKTVKHRQITGIERKVTQEVSRALTLWGLAVASHASAHAPILSGALRRSLTVSNVVQKGNRLSIKVGPDASVKAYAERQEKDLTLGFGQLSIAAGATRPWLSPAPAAMKQLGETLIRAAFMRAIR
jgi:hypothetical protein